MVKAVVPTDEQELYPGQADACSLLDLRGYSVILYDTGKPGQKKLSHKEQHWRESWNQNFMDENLDLKLMTMQRKKLRGVEVDVTGRVKKLEIMEKQLRGLPASFAAMGCLAHLDLSGNTQIGNKGMSLICDNSLPLKYLSMWKCGLTKLPYGIGNCSRLRVLKLGGNSIKSIPPTIAELTGLYELYLGYNLINSLPEEIGSLQMLKELWLIRNRELTSLPDSLCECLNLEWLDVSRSGSNL